MFMNDSTENLLDNLENELTEVIELDNPVQVVDAVAVEMPPIPAKRNLVETTNEHFEVHLNPIPVARRLQSLDKNEKNDENEIIQLSSVSSSSVSENQKNISQKTVVTAVERKMNNKVLVVQEADMVQDEETFFVTKHGKWAKNEEKADQTAPSPAKRVAKPKAHIEIVTEKPASKSLKSKSSTSTTPPTSFETSSESSSSEESLKPVKTSKKSKSKDKKRSKKKPSEESSTTSSAQKTDGKSTEPSTKAIGVFVHSTGVLKYGVTLKNLKVKISLYNEDSGKMIDDSQHSKPGTVNNDFHNFICTWNEMLVIDQDLKRLREIHNNVLLFLEVINSDDEIVFWAFLKVFSQNCTNVDDKFKLQLFKHQKVNQKTFFANFSRGKSQNDLNIFEQWRLVKRKKFSGVLSITLKTLNHNHDEAVIEPSVDMMQLSIDNINRKWQKLPGQPCKIPNKVFHKTQFQEKGSMNVRFSSDGNYIAFTEVTKDGPILHIQKFPEMQEEFTMLEHSDLIHDIDWLKEKVSVEGRQSMVTASSDFTAIVWKMETSSYTYSILPHPSFVYASKFLNSDDSSKIQVVTAGRDCIVRIWQRRKKLEGFELIQELKHPNVTSNSKSSYITTIATRNDETFYTSSSEGDVVEWTLQATKDYHMNRCLKLDGIIGHIVTSLELHPRGNKIFLRVQDFTNTSVTGTIFVLGVPTGLITQRYQQPTVNNESQGKLRLTTCGTQLFASNGNVVRFYSLLNGNMSSSKVNAMNAVKISSGEKISSMDYHPKDFYFACSVYGRNGGIVVCHFASETEEKDRFDKLKLDSNQTMHASQKIKSSGTHFTDIIRKLDEVFLAPIENEVLKQHREVVSSNDGDNNTFTVDSKRSQTYTVSQGPATYTIQRSQNNTYEIQRKDESDDDTTITESFN